MGASLDGRWTAVEDERIKRLYHRVSVDELAALFPKRTKAALYFRAWRLGLRRYKDGERIAPRSKMAHPETATWPGERTE